MRLLNSISNKLAGLFLNLVSTKSKPPSPQLVAQRFRQLFTDHGLEETQIPRVFPKIALDDLTSNEKLIQKLTPELINEAAQLFNVRSRWLDGIDCSIYDHISCYKQPEVFFQILNKIKFSHGDFPFRIITHAKPFDLNNQSQQLFSILFVEKVAALEDQAIHRYYLDTGWDWSYEHSRIQIKALALLYYQKFQTPITIYQVPYDIYVQIESHELIPHPYLIGSLTSDPSLEDYILDHSQSLVSKEDEELPRVSAYIEDHHLTEFLIDHSGVQNSKEDAAVNHQAETLQQKASRARHEPINQLKRECVLYWIANQKYSNKEAARRFYQSLSDDKRRLFSESNYEKTLSMAISEFKRKDALSEKNKLPNWLIGFNPDIS